MPCAGHHSHSPSQDTNNADSMSAALTASTAPEAKNADEDDADQPSPSGTHEDSKPANRSNARDLKATGVARAAARLLETDDPDGGLAILSVYADAISNQHVDVSFMPSGADQSSAVQIECGVNV